MTAGTKLARYPTGQYRDSPGAKRAGTVLITETLIRVAGEIEISEEDRRELNCRLAMMIQIIKKGKGIAESFRWAGTEEGSLTGMLGARW